MNYPTVYWNGHYIHHSKMSFPLNNWGFLYGYGVFETILVQDKKAVHLESHLNRLSKGAHQLKIPFTESQTTIETTIKQLLQKNKVQTAKLNIYVTPELKHGAQVLMVLRELPSEYADKSISIQLQPIKVPRSEWNQFKTMAFFHNVLERLEAPKCEDVLLVNRRKEILETTLANVFFVKGNQVITPKMRCIMQGVTRHAVLTLLQNTHFSICERKVFQNELSEFDEIFLTNAISGIIGVKSMPHYPHLKSKEKTLKIKAIYNASIAD